MVAEPLSTDVAVGDPEPRLWNETRERVNLLATAPAGAIAARVAAEAARDAATAEGDRAAAEADRAKSIAEIEVPDDVMAVVDADPASDFRKQADARHIATFGGRIALPETTGIDDAQAISDAIASAAAFGAAQVEGRVGETYYLDAPIVMRSGVTLSMYGCVVQQNSGATGNLLRSYAVDNVQRTVTGCAISSGDRTLTRTGGTEFTATDVGRSLYVPAAGPGGEELCARVVSVTNATTVELDVPAQATVAGRSCRIWERDHDLCVVGGTWNKYGISGPAGTGQHALFFLRCSGLTVRDIDLNAVSGKFGVAPADVTDVTIDNVRVKMTSSIGNSGVQVSGPAHRVHVSRIYGETHDDLVAFTARDYPGYEDTRGDMTGIVVDGIYPQGAMCALKFAGGDGTKYRGVSVRNIYGTTYQAAIRIWDDTFSPGATDIDYLTIDGVEVSTPDDGSGLHYPVVEITASQVGVLRLSNIAWPWPGTRPRMVRLEVDGYVRQLVIDGMEAVLGDDSRFVMIDGRVDDLAVRDCELRGVPGFTAAVLASVGSTVGRVDVDRVDYPAGGGSNMVDLYSTPTAVRINDSKMVAGDAVLRIRSGLGIFPATLRDVRRSGYNVVQSESPVDLTLDNIDPYADCDRLVSLYGAGASPVSICSANVRYKSIATIKRDGAQSIVMHGSIDAPVDLAILGFSPGDSAYNTNPSLPCGVGPVISNGATNGWKNLYTGGTY